MIPLEMNPKYMQGTPEWLALRKTKITATDAAVILGANPWKTRMELYLEKISKDVKPLYINEAMQRGIDLEPIARELFNLKTGWNMQPEVMLNDWAMASLDGRDADIGAIVEIKCPSNKDHTLALNGCIPDHYYPQLQHQMWIAGTSFAYYFSFDGADGVIVKVKRDEDFIQKMIEEEYRFYLCIQNKTPPEYQPGDYIERNDEIWEQVASKWKSLQANIKELEKEEEETRRQLIFLSGESNTKGAGISLCQVTRKGTVDYPTMLKQLAVEDSFVEKFRKAPTTSWRIT